MAEFPLDRLLASAEQPDLTVRLSDEDPELAPLDRWLAALQATVRHFTSQTARVAIHAARTSRHIVEVADGARAVREHAEVSSQMIDQSRQAAQEIAETASAAAGIGALIASESAQAADLLGSATESSHAIAQEVSTTEQLMAQLAQSVGRIAEMSDLIEDVAKRTNLLSLNAAIEAARAGEHGRGFRVVADEVRRLADRTQISTQEIAQLLAATKQELAATLGAVQRSAHLAGEVAGRTEQANRATAHVVGGIGEFSQMVQRIAAATQEQTASMQDAAERLQAVEGEAQSLAAATKGLEEQARRMSSDAEAGYGALGRVRAGTFVDDVRQDLEGCARELEALFDGAISDGRLTVDDALDVAYVPIVGDEVRSLSRLFRVDRVPFSGFGPPKYRTRYSEVLDGAAMQILDRYLAHSPRYLFFIAADLNAYCFTHNRRNAADWTGDAAQDNLRSRLKRIYDEPVVVAASRVGLAADGVPHPATRHDFERAGARLDERAPALFARTYLRDDGGATTLFSVPLYVAARRYGAICASWQEDG